MSSRDRTLLAALGFQDADKGPEHDLACQYLAQKDIALQVMLRKPRPGTNHYIETALEHPISKGKDQYKTTIGFVDVLYDFASSDPCPTNCYRGHTVNAYGTPFKDTEVSERCGEDHTFMHMQVGVEVKTTSTPDGDVLRQVKLYQEYLPVGFILAVTFPVTKQFQDTLESSGISVISLGPGFAAFKASVRSGGYANLMSF